MAATEEKSPHGVLRAIVWGGAGCGILDLAFALVAYGVRRGVPLIRVPQSIAAGLLGKASYDGGVATAALGTLLHFTVAFTAAALYMTASRRLKFLAEHPALWGPMYGAVVFTFMYYVVIPLSAIGRLNMTLESFWIALIGHMIFVGPPIALAANRFR